jgi:hypothetical protein
MKDGTLPGLSPRLRHETRTNSEAVLGAKARTATVDHSHGVAIDSAGTSRPRRGGERGAVPVTRRP